MLSTCNSLKSMNWPALIFSATFAGMGGRAEDSKIGDAADKGGHGAAPSMDKLSTTADIWSATDVALLAPSAGLLENNGMLIIGDSLPLSTQCERNKR